MTKEEAIESATHAIVSLLHTAADNDSLMEDIRAQDMKGQPVKEDPDVSEAWGIAYGMFLCGYFNFPGLEDSEYAKIKNITNIVDQ